MWRIGVDVGGTFTDIVARDEETGWGRVVTEGPSSDLRSRLPAIETHSR